MKRALLLPALLVVLGTGAVASAQKETAGKQEVKAVPAAAPLVRTKVKCDLMLPVVGLTQDNAMKTEKTLEGLKEDLYTCKACEVEYARAGECPSCHKPLTVMHEPVLGMVTTDAAKSQLRLQTREGMELKLSTIERALQAESIRVDTGKLMIPGHATLVVSGASTAEQATKLQKALLETKLFQSVEAEATPLAARIRVIANPTAPTLETVREHVKQVAPTFQLTDVIWNDWSVPATG